MPELGWSAWAFLFSGVFAFGFFVGHRLGLQEARLVLDEHANR